MRTTKRTLFALLASLIITSPAQASDYMSLNAGGFDINNSDTDALQFGMEYRGEYVAYNIRPTAGGFITDDGSVYGYAGMNLDLPIADQFFLIPNFAVGVYTKGDDGKDLGGALEFRSGIELAYQFENEHQIGLAFNHISNAGIYDNNPGEESLLMTYSIPLNSIGSLIGGQ